MSTATHKPCESLLRIVQNSPAEKVYPIAALVGFIAAGAVSLFLTSHFNPEAAATTNGTISTFAGLVGCAVAMKITAHLRSQHPDMSRHQIYSSPQRKHLQQKATDETPRKPIKYSDSEDEEDATHIQMELQPTPGHSPKDGGTSIQRRRGGSKIVSAASPSPGHSPNGNNRVANGSFAGAHVLDVEEIDLSQRLLAADEQADL